MGTPLIKGWLPPLCFWLLGCLCLAETPHKLLVMAPASESFQQVLQTLKEELDEQFVVTYRQVDQKTDYGRFETIFLEEEPRVLVLMDNSAIYNYRRFQSKYAGTRSFPPAVAAMALVMDSLIEDMTNIQGIRYEVSAVTSLVHLRDMVSVSLKRVGVVYQPAYESFYQRQATYCRSEAIELVGFRLEQQERSSPKALRKALNHLIRKEKVDALWVVNDSYLLTPGLVRNVWLPRLRKFYKPVIVGVKPLIDPVRLGNFAVLPDHSGMGKQIAEVLYSMQDNDWQVDSARIYEPISARSILNVRFGTRHFGLQTDKLGQVDVTIDPP